MGIERAKNSMRLFIAIQFHNNLRRRLEECQRELKAHGITGNFTAVENLHLTLAFIGEYPDSDYILGVMEEVPFEPFSIRLEGVGTFRDLLWAGIEKNNALAAYVRRLRMALAEHTIPFDRKKFAPHITLVRKMRFAGARQVTQEDLAFALQSENLLKDFGNKMENSGTAVEMAVKKISLMRSDRGRHGMIYTEIGSVS